MKIVWLCRLNTFRREHVWDDEAEYGRWYARGESTSEPLFWLEFQSYENIMTTGNKTMTPVHVFSCRISSSLSLKNEER